MRHCCRTNNATVSGRGLCMGGVAVQECRAPQGAVVGRGCGTRLAAPPAATHLMDSAGVQVTFILFWIRRHG